MPTNDMRVTNGKWRAIHYNGQTQQGMYYAMTTQFEHAENSDLAKQAKDAQRNTAQANLRTFEIMFLELRSLFQVDKDIDVVSYSQDGDPDNYPVMYCGSAQGEDLTDGGEEEIFDAAEAISDRWNESLGVATVAFLQVNDQVEFRRSTFAKDVEKQLEQLIRQELVPLEDGEAREWAASFVAYLGTLEGVDNPPAKGRKAKP